MKISKRSRWIILLIVSLVFLAVVFTETDSVQAIFNSTHALKVFLRVETEIMQTTPAGQYYESLFWKHNDELMQIMRAYPEHKEKFLSVTLMFVPELDALLNGDGDKVYVTAEHVESLKTELDWFASVGSPALRDDIERERQRLPLDSLVGMTMREVLDFINSNVSPNPVIEKTLVPNSDGKWAYYVHNGVYFEYPVNYSIQVSGTESNYLYLIPTAGSPDQWNPCVMKFHIWKISVGERDSNNPHSWYRDSIVWENAIQSVDFPGIEFVSSMPQFPVMDFRAYQYNEENQVAVDIWLFGNENPLMADSSAYSEMINQRYEYFQHLVESFRIQPQ